MRKVGFQVTGPEGLAWRVVMCAFMAATAGWVSWVTLAVFETVWALYAP